MTKEKFWSKTQQHPHIMPSNNSCSSFTLPVLIKSSNKTKTETLRTLCVPRETNKNSQLLSNEADTHTLIGNIGKSSSSETEQSCIFPPPSQYVIGSGNGLKECSEISFSFKESTNPSEQLVDKREEISSSPNDDDWVQGSSQRMSSTPVNNELKSRDFFQNFDRQNTFLHASLIVHDLSYNIMKLLEESPEYVFAANKSGDLPLHYAAMDKKIVENQVLDKLLNLNPGACSKLNCDRNLPLHLHCMIGAPSLYFVQKMLQISPSSAYVQSEIPVSSMSSEKTKSDSGFNVGSEVCLLLGLEDTLKYLIGETHHNKRKKKIEVGWSPLHLAVYNGAPIEVIVEILRVAPQSAFLRTNKDRTALDCGEEILKRIANYNISKEKNTGEIKMLSLMKRNALNTKLAVNMLREHMTTSTNT